jgi:hypothetical protein
MTMAKNEKYIQRHKAFQKYAEKEMNAGRRPMKFKDFKIEDVYFRGASRPTYESQMKAAGIDWEKEKPSARLKRSKAK